MNLKTLPVGRLLWILTLMSALVLISVEVFNSMTIRKLTSHLTDVGRTQLPAVRAMTLADMMHDGLRAVVYRSIIASQTNDQAELEVAFKEYQEFSENIAIHLGEIEKLGASDEVKEQTKEAIVKVNTYLQAGEKVLNLTAQGKTEAAIAQLADYQKVFESLEEELRVLGEKIEKEASTSVEASLAISEGAKFWALLIAVLGSAIGLLFSLWINKSITSRLSEVSGVLSLGSRGVAIAVTELSTASSNLSAAATQQSSTLEQTASAIHEISSMVKRSAELADDADHSSQQSKAKAQQGGSIIAEMMDSMRTINNKTGLLAEQMNESNQKLSSIVQVINEVADKTKVINEIVFQTKLLSFNASIEAARAGEHGKGFSVVAEEVGNLAQMSGSAAKEINSLLEQNLSNVKAIIEETKHKVESSLSSTKNAVSQGNETAERCGHVFRELVEASARVSDMVSSISQASAESSKGVEEISSALSELNSAVHINVSASNDCADASRKLEEQVVRLRESTSSLNLLANGQKMVQKFEWKESYALGVQKMDDEHKVLIERINTLVEAIESNDDLKTPFKDLSEYTDHHFSEEEKYMMSISYPELSAHKKIHSQLLSQVADYGEQISGGKVDGAELINFLNDWLLKHILGVDMKYAKFSRTWRGAMNPSSPKIPKEITRRAS